MDTQKAWDIVIAEVESECRMCTNCYECPLEYPCSNLDEVPYETLKKMKEALYKQD